MAEVLVVLAVCSFVVVVAFAAATWLRWPTQVEAAQPGARRKAGRLRKVLIALGVGVVVLVAAAGILFASWSEQYSASWNSACGCDPAGAFWPNSFPEYPNAVLVAKEHCSCILASDSTFYFATTATAAQVNDFFAGAIADFDAAHTPGGSGAFVTVATLGAKLPPPASDVSRLKVATAPEGTRTYFSVHFESFIS